jgi:hypothetical protein
MRALDPALERRHASREPSGRACEVVVGDTLYPATVVNASHGGAFVRTEASAERGTPVSVVEHGEERLAVVVHVLRPARSLLRATLGGLGLRWLVPR